MEDVVFDPEKKAQALGVIEKMIEDRHAKLIEMTLKYPETAIADVVACENDIAALRSAYDRVKNHKWPGQAAYDSKMYTKAMSS